MKYLPHWNRGTCLLLNFMRVQHFSACNFNVSKKSWFGCTTQKYAKCVLFWCSMTAESTVRMECSFVRFVRTLNITVFITRALEVLLAAVETKNAKPQCLEQLYVYYAGMHLKSFGIYSGWIYSFNPTNISLWWIAKSYMSRCGISGSFIFEFHWMRMKKASSNGWRRRASEREGRRVKERQGWKNDRWRKGKREKIRKWGITPKGY